MKKLNVPKIQDVMYSSGFNQTDLATLIGVSKESVSKWIKGDKFPRPKYLLKLAQILKLEFKDIVTEVYDESTPLVAYRKKGNKITKEEHIKKAIEVGKILKKLEPYAGIDEFTRPPTLKSPKVEYHYISALTSKIRSDLQIKPGEELPFPTLIDYFKKLNCVIIPVLLGPQEDHENALHIYFQDSMISWTYLNLDTNILDFKFWMAHELGHIFTPELINFEDDTCEEFAELFANLLLFPEDLAAKTHNRLLEKATCNQRMTHVINIARELHISPYTIIKGVEALVKEYDLTPISFGTNYYGRITNFHKEHALVSEQLLQNDFSAKNYIETGTNSFKTDFFNILKNYIQSNDVSKSFVQQILKLSLIDSQAVYRELKK